MSTADKAILISLFSLFLAILKIIIDVVPRVKVSAYTEIDTVDYVDGMPVLDNKHLWITISNHSARRIFITNIIAKRNWWLTYRWNKIDLKDLQRYEDELIKPGRRFWIEPWGNVVLGTNGIEFEHTLEKLLHKRDALALNQFTQLIRPQLIYRIEVYDGQQKKYQSNKIRLATRHIVK